MNNLIHQTIETQNQWHLALKSLEGEDLKLASYDKTLLEELGDVKDKKILDYGSGPGVLALALKKLGANITAYDINLEMSQKAGEKIGKENSFSDLGLLEKSSFDIIICNLVLCIVSEDEAKNVVDSIRGLLKPNGVVYIGFCNPKIHNVPESQLDFRFYSGLPYYQNHSYRKIKKEGIYEIVENHRPVDWYAKLFYSAGLLLLDILLTPEYKIRNQKIIDFTIFKLQK